VVFYLLVALLSWAVDELESETCRQKLKCYADNPRARIQLTLKSFSGRRRLLVAVVHLTAKTGYGIVSIRFGAERE